MAGYHKDELKRQYQIAQREKLVRNGQGVMQDFTFISKEDLAELAECNLRLAHDGESHQVLYLDDKRPVRVCPTEQEPVQILVTAGGRQNDQAQNPEPATTPRRRREPYPKPAQA